MFSIVSGSGSRQTGPVKSRAVPSAGRANAACWAVALAPSLALLLLPRPPFDVSGNATYLRYREVVGGNPSEVYSHFLDFVLMTGNAVALGALVLLKAWHVEGRRTLRGAWHSSVVFLWLGMGTSGTLGHWLDSRYGEGAVLVVYVLSFVPVLIATWVLLHRLAECNDWRKAAVARAVVACILVHAGLQYLYEPSNTGAPNYLFLPIWLTSLGYLWYTFRNRPLRGE